MATVTSFVFTLAAAQLCAAVVVFAALFLTRRHR
jgi:hypothetical protein